MIKVGLSCTTHNSPDINPRGHEALATCLESFFDSIQYDFSVFIIDNSSERTFSHKLLDDHRVHYIYIEDQLKNGGLTGAWNVGVKKCYDDGCGVILNSNDDVVFNPSINNFISTISSNTEISDLGFFGPICNPGGSSTHHQIRTTNKTSEKIIETTYALNGFFNGFSKHFFEKFNVNGNLYSTKREDMWGGQEVELFQRNTPSGMRSFILENCYLYHTKYRSWLNARNKWAK